MRTDLRDHPKVVRMSSALNADRLRIIGGLWSVWSTFDTHSVDGTLEGYTLAAIDEDLRWPGFAQAMESVQWLVQVVDGLEVPEFDVHNGASAKRRAQDTRDKKNKRESAKCPQSVRTQVGQMSASDADKVRTREREREDIKEGTPVSLLVGDEPKAGKGVVSLPTWLAAIKARGEKPIPEGDPILAYADQVGLPYEFMTLAWREFRARYSEQGAKRYRDWRAVFRKAVRGNWLKLWWIDGQSFALTTVGMQAQRAHKDAA